jgi:hypothetical protein
MFNVPSYTKTMRSKETRTAEHMFGDPMYTKSV